MIDSTLVENIKPYRTYSFITTIPATTPVFTQIFPYSVNFSNNDYNYVSRISIRVDTSGIYNITTTEVFQLGGVATTIDPGYYTITQLQTIANVTIPVNGAGAFYVTNGSTLQFITNSQLASILGYSSFGTTLIPIGTKSTTPVDQTDGYDFLAISSSLISTSTGFGSNFLTTLPINIASPGIVVSDEKRMEVPILNNQFQSIQWYIYTGNEKPFVINTPIIIFTEISSIRKLV